MKKNEDNCECNMIHNAQVEKAKKRMLPDEVLLDLADFFKLFSDSTRVKIINSLLHTELCVCDIAFLLGMTKSAISHQLHSLRQGKLVKSRREGKVIFYSLDDKHIKTIMSDGINHVSEK
ncbi:MAG: metalloregulator ArsR/SmtB family transcription factor [Termitinemataceae bacterium]|nr:MAG: metalloregulator ArsR/SmtB family transcription factor [Termitinemataceae bacterium]